MPEKWSICDLHQSLTLNSMEMPDTISVFYYSQHALVLAINIPLLAIAFSQEKKSPNNQKHQRAWKMFWEAEECYIYLGVLQLKNPRRIWPSPVPPTPPPPPPNKKWWIYILKEKKKKKEEHLLKCNKPTVYNFKICFLLQHNQV